MPQQGLMDDERQGYRGGGGGGTSNTGGNLIQGVGQYFGIGRPTTVGHYDAPQVGRDDYFVGGSQQAFQGLVNDSNQRAETYAGRNVAFDPSKANSSLNAANRLRANEQALTGLLERQARGEGPSVAEDTYRRAADDATRRAASAATSARGGQGLLGARRASEIAYEGGQDAAANAGMIRKQEMLEARGLLGQQLAQRNASELARGGLGLDIARTGTEFGQRQMQINDSAEQAERGRGLQLQGMNQQGLMGYNQQQSANQIGTNQLNAEVDKTNLQQINAQNAKRGGVVKKIFKALWLSKMPYTHATPRPDGGVDFHDAATGATQTLYGQTALSFAQRLPSMATSEAAFADASGAGGAGGPGPAPDAPPPPAPVVSDVGTGGAGGAGGLPETGGAIGSSGVDPYAQPKAPPLAASGEGGAPGAGGRSIGIGDVGGVTGTGGGNPYGSLSTTLKLAAVDDLLRGGGATKAGWIPQGESTVRKGTASEETIRAIQAAVDQSGEALGGKADVARQNDQAQQATYRAAAEKALASSQAIEDAQRREVEAFQRRAARLEEQAAREDRNAPGLRGILNRIADGDDEGDALLMAANTGTNPADALRALTAARQAKGTPRDEADKALVEGAKAIRVGELAKTEAYTNYLQNVLKSQESEYKALGREPELRAQLAELERRKAELRGEREAALQGDTTSTRKYRPASTGGGAAAKLRAAEILASLSGGQSGPSVLVGDLRVPVDPKLPEAVRNDLYKQVDSQALAETALRDVKRYHDLLTASDHAAYKAGVTTPAMAKFLSAVSERTAHAGVARGQGAQQDAEREVNEGRYLSIWGSEGHIERELESDRQNRIRLLRKATGRDPVK